MEKRKLVLTIIGVVILAMVIMVYIYFSKPGRDEKKNQQTINQVQTVQQKLGFVPEAQNDMIFSIICEELGLTGAFFLIVIFGLLMWRLMVIALHCRELQGTLLCVGIMSHMAIQVILNIAVVTNTIPNTGITLPFISYGGTSVVFLLGEMGLALSVSRK